MSSGSAGLPRSLRSDTTDGKNWTCSGATHGLKERDSARGDPLVGGGAEYVSGDEPAGSLLLGDAGLLHGVYARPEGKGGRDAAGVGDPHRARGELRASGSDAQRDVDPVVDDEPASRFLLREPECLRQAEEAPGGNEPGAQVNRAARA